ncbi:MAG: hypothetical protein K6F30_09800 [Lachnospiraceae bacterium]|nr:hypothetical protein [Lachnospiraceae bacterium]
MNSKNRMEEREINLLNILWNMAEQWKPLLLVALLCAFFLTSVMYMKDLKSYQSAVAVGNEERKVDDIRKELTEEELSDVEYAVSINENLIEKQDYLKDSIWLNLDANDVSVIRSQYYISSDFDGLSCLYDTSLSNPVFLQNLKDAMGITSDVDEKYVQELISTNLLSESNDSICENAFIVTIILPKTAKVDSISSVLDSYILEEVHGKVGKTVEHTIVKVDEIETTDIISDIVDTRVELTNTIASIEATLTASTSAFSENQNIVYQALIDKKDDVGAKLNEKEDVGVSKDTLLPPSVSAKYFAIGLLLGVILYGVILILMEVTNTTITDAKVVQDVYGVRIIENIHARKNIKAIDRFMHSSIIYRLRYKNESKDYDGRIESVKKDVTEYVAHKGYSNESYLMVGDLKDISETNLAKTIVTNDVKESNPIVFVIYSGISKYEEFQNMLVKASDFDCPVVGAIFVEE